MNRIAKTAATALVALGLTLGVLPLGGGFATLQSPGSSGCCKVAL